MDWSWSGPEDLRLGGGAEIRGKDMVIGEEVRNMTLGYWNDHLYNEITIVWVHVCVKERGRKKGEREKERNRKSSKNEKWPRSQQTVRGKGCWVYDMILERSWRCSGRRERE